MAANGHSILVENVSKVYRITGTVRRYRTLRDSLSSLARHAVARLSGSPPPETTELWALKDVSFEAKPGEVVGIIGRNGAGKSTLLKILSRITQPTSGRAELRGRVGSLLEVGTGFHTELTGRENVYLGGAILGMSRAEVRARFDEIVEFSGIEAFLDEPMKHYSSGMQLRLAFAVAAHLPAEILLADEVLAVGDAAFQQKCLAAMSEVSRGGRTVLFVSHNLGAVADLCTWTMLIEGGRLIASGPTQEIITRYLTRFEGEMSRRIHPPPADRGARLESAAILDAAGAGSPALAHEQPFSIRIEYSVTRRIPDLSIGVSLVNQQGVRAVWMWATFSEPHEPGIYFAEGTFPGSLLAPGRYYLDVSAQRYRVEDLHTQAGCASFEIVRAAADFDAGLPGWGVLLPDIPWERGVARPAGEQS